MRLFLVNDDQSSMYCLCTDPMDTPELREHLGSLSHQSVGIEKNVSLQPDSAVWPTAAAQSLSPPWKSGREGGTDEQREEKMRIMNSRRRPANHTVSDVTLNLVTARDRYMTAQSFMDKLKLITNTKCRGLEYKGYD